MPNDLSDIRAEKAKRRCWVIKVRWKNFCRECYHNVSEDCVARGITQPDETDAEFFVPYYWEKVRCIHHNFIIFESAYYGAGIRQTGIADTTSKAPSEDGSKP